MCWASSQHGGTRVIRLLTWQLKALKMRIQSTGQKQHALLGPGLGSHIVSLSLNSIGQRSHKTTHFQGRGHKPHLSWEKYQRSCGHDLKPLQQCKLLYIEWINNEALPYSTGNYIQYPVINHNGKEYIYICIYIKYI